MSSVRASTRPSNTSDASWGDNQIFWVVIYLETEDTLMSVGTTVIDIASYVAAGVMAASKLVSVTQPWWNKLPRWLAVAAPVLVLDLPQIASWFNGAVTGTDVMTAFVTSVALLLPGLAEAEAAPPAPPAA